MLDGPAVVNVNIFVRSISKIDDVVMVSELRSETDEFFHNFVPSEKISSKKK
jgi:hypothetical protein